MFETHFMQVAAVRAVSLSGGASDGDAYCLHWHYRCLGMDNLSPQFIGKTSIVLWEMDDQDCFTFLDHDGSWQLPAAVCLCLSDWMRGIHPDDLERVAQARREARAAGRRFQLDYRIAAADGKFRWVRDTGVPRPPRAGEAPAYTGAFIDISDRYDVEARLAVGEAEHRLLTENARDLIAYSDADNTYLYVSPSHLEILGYTQEEMVGTNVLGYLHPADLAAMTRARSAETAGEARSGMHTMRVRHKNGNWIWLGINSRTIHDPHSGKSTGFVAVGRDITLQLAAERELARREQQFRSLTSLSSDWYWETDHDGRFTFLSDGIHARLGLRPADLLGASLEAFALDTTEAGYIACRDSVLARLPFHDAVYSVGLAGYPGVVRFIRISGEPIFEDGNFVGYRGATRDVTHEVRNAKALQHLATHDHLTGLANRAVLETRLRQRTQDRRGNANCAVLFIDLDRFKDINDSLGHKAGDMLLEEIAARLKRCVRPDDTVARLGGDEFVILADCSHGAESAGSIADKLLLALNVPHALVTETGSHTVHPSASIGISLFPQDGDIPERLLQDADCALYRAKRDGKACYRFFHRNMRTVSRAA
jgi:diguanylate cyclase (GGDEF)-like protein/PAS domain S-box-containing protein